MAKKKNNEDLRLSIYGPDLFIALLFSLAEVVLCFLFDGCFDHRDLMFYLAIPVFIAGRTIFISGLGKLLTQGVTLDTLISIGALASFIVSTVNTFFPLIYGHLNTYLYVYYEPAVIAISLCMVGKYLLQRPLNKVFNIEITKRELEANLVTEDDTIIKIPADNIRVGNVLYVNTGELFPADGIVLEGITEADENFIKRASSIRKYPGDEVIGGSLNKTENVKILITHAGSDTAINKLMKFVNERATFPTNKADQIAKKFLFALVIISALTSASWFILAPHEGALHIIRHALEVFIAGCPCALALALPFAWIEGYDKLIEKGLLIKNPDVINKLRKTDTLVIDKSGVLTLGKPEVSEVIWKGDASKKEKLKSVIFSVERKATDEKAASIAEYFSKDGAAVLNVQELEEFESRGIRARVNDELYYIGTDAFIGLINHGRYFKKEEYIIHEVSGMEYFFDDIELQNQVQRLKELGQAVYLAADSKAVFAIIGIGEGIRKSTASTIKNLKEKKINVVLMTSESREAAQSISEKLDLDDIYAEVLPFSKSEIISNLQKQGKVVTFAGVGREDAPALAQADASFVMVEGNDIAVENADAILLNGDISKISEAIDLSQSLNSIIRSNIFWSLIFSIVAVFIATGAFESLLDLSMSSAIATLSIALSTIAVVLNNFKTKKL